MTRRNHDDLEEEKVTTKVRILVAVFMALGMAGIRSAHPTYASGGNVGDCTFGTLQSDLQSGGDWFYVVGQCPGAITFGGTITISSNASLTANGNDVTLDGVNSYQLFAVNSGVTFTLNSLILSHGSASANGGAILNDGTLTITNSTLSNNTAACSPTPCPADGGAIDNNGTLSVTASTFSGNSAGSAGGAIGNNRTATITTSTFSGNSAAMGGGAVNNNDTLTITDSTLANNSAPTAGNVFISGGAIRAYYGTVSIGGSIVAENTVGGNPENCSNAGASGTIVDLGYNLESGTDCGFTGSGSIQSTDPQLDLLASNGGPTQTIALRATSPAIDKIPTSDGTLCPGSSTDQRGMSRPDSGEDTCDIGAYEFQELASPTFTTQASETANGVVGSAVLSDAATLSGGSFPTGTISFSLTAPDGTTAPEGTASVNGNGIYTAPTTVAATEVGIYTWHAHYSGDSNNNAADDRGQNESLTTIQASPSLSTTPGGTVTVGSGAKLTDSATLSGGYNPGASVTFYLMGPGATASTPLSSAVYTDVVSVTGNGPYSTASGNNPGGYLPTAGGAYQWVVVYSGDANNQSTTSPFGAESETVNNDADLDLTNMPPNISKIASSSAGATVTYTSPTAVDEAGDSPAATVGCGPASGSVFPIGTTTVTCRATDSDDTNSPVSKSFTVTVRYGVKLLYKAPMSGKVGSAVPIKIELVSASGQNLSSSSLTVNALCVVVQGAKDCSGSAPMSFGGGSPFTFMASLDNGGGYQFNAKTTSLTIGKTYQLLFRVAGEDSTSFHADAGATFTLTK